MRLNKYLQLVVLIFTAFGCRDNSSDQAVPTNKLILVEDLMHIKQLPEAYIFVDCRPADDYSQGHIPGAVNIWRNESSDTLGLLLSMSAIESLLSAKGISPDHKLILYDDHGSCEAARLWWLLYIHGHENSQILNGGFSMWKANNGPVTNTVEKRNEQLFSFPLQRDWSLVANYEEVYDASQNNTAILIDARSPEEFNGDVIKKGSLAAGHIPGSIHVDYTSLLLNPEERDLRFLPIDSLEVIFAKIADSKDDPIIVYCHSGVRSAHLAFVLRELLHYTNVKNYDGSWIDWTRRMAVSEGPFSPAIQ